MELLAAMSLPGLAAAVLSPVSVVLFGLFGYRHGLFLVTVIGLLLLTGFLGALALAPAGVAFLEAFDCPPAHALAASYCGLFGLAAAACRFGIGEIVQEDDVRLGEVADKVGGLVVGGFVGGLVAGAILVGWSMWELPRGLKPDATMMKTDAGVRALRTFARCTHADPQARERLLNGDLERNAMGGSEAGGALVSEPFDDADGNWIRGDKEPFLDHDHDGRFTISAPALDHSNGSEGRRPVGLLEAYWLGAWRTARVVTAPRLTSPARSEAETRGDEQPLYRTTAADPDAGDTLTFSIAAREGDDSRLVAIDPATGAVTLVASQVGPDDRAVRFTVLVTDRAGLTDEQEVVVTLPAGSG